ncbi:MAG TPA: hypothetical protein VLA09_02155, partial [Longimicrobiales bacterium]|nr:hypothetical protein [Longimicrobiales bacterium]
IGPVWLLGRFLILAGAVALPPLRVGLPSGLPESSRVRSGVAGILVIVAVTMVLGVGLVEAVSTDGRPAELEGVVFVLACVVFVIVIAGVARRFDRAVAFLGRWVEDLVDNRLTPAAWEGGGVVSRSTLRITRLDSLFKLIASAAGRLRNDVIFLGPERLYPVYGPGPETKQVSCFVVMPFGLPWSDEVHATIRRAAEAQGVQSIRGDDIFTPTDILTDIWIGINRADFIIADITGRNANVLYELGIAHTLAKPVLILTQSVEDVPIDLATRRMIVYGDPKSGELRQKLDKGIGEILDEYDWSREAPGRGLRSTASEHDDPVDRADRD